MAARELDADLAIGQSRQKPSPDRLAETVATSPSLDKVSKSAADYTNNGPRPFVCGNCRWYHNSDCEIVTGRISSRGSCRYYHRGQDVEADEEQREGEQEPGHEHDDAHDDDHVMAPARRMVLNRKAP